MSNRQRIVLLLIAAVVLAGGVLLALASGGDDEPDDRAATTPTGVQTDATGTTPDRRRKPPERVEAIPIEDGGPVGDPQTLEYERGDLVVLRFRADRAEEVHIHGFDLTVDVPARGAIVSRFRANIEGIFEIEAHRTGEQLARLEIRPK
ncbi:MAG TPA: hypothetical protein VHF89_16935 [Solirubrobacteraceae bacterium]|nr:hypothetical protein [Solirubrobacteraceae bacterium]